jgi:tRNA threonylcarbamoyladenosine biosynthesis protein TsaB
MNGKQIALVEQNNQHYSHAEQLHVFIEQALSQADIDADQLDAIAVSMGPGSYTGLRIGVSAAKGLCFALDLPLIAVPTLDILAQQISVDKGFIAPMLDARRLEVYCAVYDHRYHQIQNTQAKILNEATFDDLLKNHYIYFIGSGVEKTKTLINHKNAKFIDGKFPSAKEMCGLSYNKFKASQFENVAYFEPFYLKDFVGLKAKIKTIAN